MKSINEIQVLIVEDDFLISDQIGRILKRQGYQVAGYAQDGEKAIEMAHKLQPDLILMDIRMPKLNGLEASKQIFEQCQIPVVILTAHSSADLLSQASEIGVMTYLIKPPNPDEISRAITFSMARSNDLNRYRQLTRQLQKLLSEKEILMKEIHHRVKNNMNVISGLLELQKQTIDDEKARAALDDSQSRVQTMSKIHETLYRSNNFMAVAIKPFLADLGLLIVQSSDNSRSISINIDSGDIFMTVKQACSLGLVVNELITNSLKYAFPEGHPGRIDISFSKDPEGIVELQVRDNGIGLEMETSLDQFKSLGLKLVNALVSNQLGGSIELKIEKGTNFIIRFPLDPVPTSLSQQDFDAQNDYVF